MAYIIHGCMIVFGFDAALIIAIAILAYITVGRHHAD